MLITQPRVRVHQTTLGGSNRATQFSLAENITSEFRGTSEATHSEAHVQAISDVLYTLDAEQRIQPGSGAVGVLKLNIEGGEYEVLESLLASSNIYRMRCLLFQFHQQSADSEQRYTHIIEGLQATHQRVWLFPMVWEKWALRSVTAE